MLAGRGAVAPRLALASITGTRHPCVQNGCPTGWEKRRQPMGRRRDAGRIATRCGERTAGHSRAVARCARGTRAANVPEGPHLGGSASCDYRCESPTADMGNHGDSSRRIAGSKASHRPLALAGRRGVVRLHCRRGWLDERPFLQDESTAAKWYPASFRSARRGRRPRACIP